jgi:predicted alpha-1,2-mannosidase
MKVCLQLLLAVLYCLFYCSESTETCQLTKEQVQYKLHNHVEEFINILGGTNSRYDMSYGATLPLMTRPWGFNSYAPQTDNDPTWPGFWYHSTDMRMFGMRVTHQPSPWLGDYGAFLIKAYMPSDLEHIEKDLFSGYSSKKATFSPFYFRTKLYSTGTTNGFMQIELSPTNHGGIMRLTYPEFVEQENDIVSAPFSQNRRVHVVLNGAPDFAEIVASPLDQTLMIRGYSKQQSSGVGNPSNTEFAHYFVIAIYREVQGRDEVITMSEVKNFHISSTDTYIDLPPEYSKNQIISLRFATSFISWEQAMANFEQELPLTKTFDNIHEDAKSDWVKVLRRMKIEDVSESYTACEAHDLLTIFYTSIYRASLYPRQLSETSRSGELLHWSPYAQSPDDRVQKGWLSTDSGFWDAWNTVYPLLSLVNRPQLSIMLQGWLQSYKEGGWLPKWASPGYRSSMIGTMADVSIADAIVKNIPNFNQTLAYEAIRKDAFITPPQGVEGIGRVCLEAYLKYGYIPRGANMTTGGECYDVISRSLNYLQSDYAIAQAASVLHYDEDAAILSKRAHNYDKIFDFQTGLFRAKDISSEAFISPFDQYGWGFDYTEGGPWQYRFYVPYDVDGLRALYAKAYPMDEQERKTAVDETDDSFCRKLKEAQTMEHSIAHIGGNDVEIKEMTEFIESCWGQYAHNDQPSHHILYMHNYGGYRSHCANQGRVYVRKTLLELYKATVDMFVGDEDNGEMSAWFLLSSIGLYARSPGSDEYIFGVPLFDKVILDISDDSEEDRKLIIVAHNNHRNRTHIDKINWNGKEIDPKQNGIGYRELMKGGVLEFFFINQ